MSKHEPREGDRVRFNPARSETVIEGHVTSAGQTYGPRKSGLVFCVDGVMWATHPTRWTTEETATDHETYLVENLAITRRRYEIGDMVDYLDLARLPQRSAVAGWDGVLWVRVDAAGWKNVETGAWRTHASLDSPDVGGLKIVHLP